MVSGASEQSDRTALVHRLLRYYAGPSNDTASDRDVISEHMGHLCVSSTLLSFPTYLPSFCSIGACDTTSTTLSYLCWELSRRPDILGKLQAELDTVMPDCRTFPDISILQDLPYLSAFVKEGRLDIIFIASLVSDHTKVFVFTVLLRAYLSALCQVRASNRPYLKPSI
jgi:hypothetical protein